MLMCSIIDMFAMLMVLNCVRLPSHTPFSVCVRVLDRLETSDALMNSIEEKVASASSQATAHAQRKEIAEAKADEMKNKMKAAVEMDKGVLSGGLFDIAPEDRERGTGSGRGKRRR